MKRLASFNYFTAVAGAGLTSGLAGAAGVEAGFAAGFAGVLVASAFLGASFLDGAGGGAGGGVVSLAISASLSPTLTFRPGIFPSSAVAAALVTPVCQTKTFFRDLLLESLVKPASVVLVP